MKNLKRSGSVLECLTRDPGIRVWAALAQCVMSLSKTHFSLLSTILTQDYPSRNNWKIVEWYVKYQIKAKVNMHGSRNFRQGWSWSIWHIKSYDNGFFFGPQLILQKTNGYFHRKLSFSEVPEGIQHFFQGGGGSNYFQGAGVQLLISYRNQYNLWFSRGGGVRTPIPPLDPPMVKLKTCRISLALKCIETLDTRDRLLQRWMVLDLYSYLADKRCLPHRRAANIWTSLRIRLGRREITLLANTKYENR